ncbi:MAG: zinc ribbon domain-containing protein [Candidatus Riflebacteria bacterium]|nr:zinc ribbon domain-containing protein [Candidatus Riflebacteria bacterium]
MPFYDYQAPEGVEGCPHCREGFEVRQNMSDERLTRCPECGGEVQRIITGVNVVRSLWRSENLTPERLKRSGFKKLVKDDDGRYVDATPK